MSMMPVRVEFLRGQTGARFQDLPAGISIVLDQSGGPGLKVPAAEKKKIGPRKGQYFPRPRLPGMDIRSRGQEKADLGPIPRDLPREIHEGEYAGRDFQDAPPRPQGIQNAQQENTCDELNKCSHGPNCSHHLCLFIEAWPRHVPARPQRTVRVGGFRARAGRDLPAPKPSHGVIYHGNSNADNDQAVLVVGQFALLAVLDFSGRPPYIPSVVRGGDSS